MRERIDRLLGSEGLEDRFKDIIDVAKGEDEYRELLKKADAENDPKYKSPDEFSDIILEGIEGKKAQQKLIETNEKLLVDPLTGIFNTNYINSNSESIVNREKRTREKGNYPGFTLIFIDIDDFKPINDTYGHPRGDEVLKSVADIIRGGNATRGSDIACRVGGDEFIILMPECDSQGAEKVIKRINTKLAEIKMDFLGDQGISLSIGYVNGKDILDKGWDEMYRRADCAMLYGKEKLGKGRVINFDDVPKDFSFQFEVNK
jgi:two-component system, cell cycle response regulator